MTSKYTKVQRLLVTIIESEGGQVVGVRKGGNHLKIDYTFDNIHFFTTHAPHSMNVGPRWEQNFRADVRKRLRETQP